MVAASLLALLFCGSTAGVRAADFGAPPSGEYPILYNDHTVYATPDTLKQNRVLAALVKNGRIYVPLRSMFEEMGATVTASADGKTVTAVKPGASVSVTVGKDEVIVNGEARPLDVPPIVYNGIVLVPVRVLSEALGAYVQWVPDRRVVVVRYIVLPPPPTPVPTPMPIVVPTPMPTPTPSPTPSPSPTPPSYQVFVAAAATAVKNYNEFTSAGWCDEYMINGAYAPRNSALAVKVDFRQDAYVTSSQLTDAIGNHYTQFATIDGGVAFTPVFLGRQSSLDARLEYQVAAPRIYIGAGYLHTANNYGYPQLNGFGFGVEKLPDLTPGISFLGSAFYYPSASGNYTVMNAASINNGTTYRQQYQILKWDIGLALAARHSPLYLFGGFAGDDYTVKQNAPIGQRHDGPYLGLGLKL